MFFLIESIAAAQPSQGKLEGRETTQTLEMNYDYFKYSRPVSSQRRQQQLQKKVLKNYVSAARETANKTK